MALTLTGNVLSKISFCDKQCSNVNDNKFKAQVIQNLEYRSVVEKYILKHFKVAWFYSDMQGMTIDCSKLALDIMEVEKEQVINNNWMNYIFL